MEFLLSIGLRPDTVTIPLHRPEWRGLYTQYDVRIEFDPECVWSDGVIGGDCTEFYREGVELGNIVNPLGDCLDCGFGMERIQRQVDEICGVEPQHLGNNEVLHRTIDVLLDSGVVPSNQKQGYVLRKLIRQQLRGGGRLSQHPHIERERQRREQILKRLPDLLRRCPGIGSDELWQTHGIHPDDRED
jgi:hypothetical protein